MSDDSTKLVDRLMEMLGENPSEAVGQVLSALSDSSNSEDKSNEKDSDVNFDPSILIKLQGIMSMLSNDETDQRSALLLAIKPFLSDDKKPKVDQAIKLLKLSQIAKTAQDLDLFKGLL